MKNKPLVLVPLLVGIVTFAGCDRLQKDEYRFVTTSTGQAYVFHPKTGKIAIVTDHGMHTLQESTAVLRVGEYYKIEDGSGDTPFVKYVGGGKFEPSKYAVKKVAD